MKILQNKLLLSLLGAFAAVLVGVGFMVANDGGTRIEPLSYVSDTYKTPMYNVPPEEINRAHLRRALERSVNFPGQGEDTLIVEDCDMFMDLYRMDEEAVGYILGWRYHTHLRRCFTYGYLKTHPAQPFTVANFSLEDPRQDIIKRFNLGSFRSSFGPRIPENGKLYMTDPREALTIRLEKGERYPKSIVMKSWEDGTLEWYYSIDLIAAGDWTGDGRADLLVTFTDQAAQSSYYVVETLLLEAPDANGDIIAHAMEDLVKEANSGLSQ